MNAAQSVQESVREIESGDLGAWGLALSIAADSGMAAADRAADRAVDQAVDRGGDGQGISGAIDRSIDQLIQGDFQVRWDAAKRLGHWGEASLEAVLDLGDRLHRSADLAEDEELVWFWARLLGDLGHPQGIAPLVTLLAGQPEAVVAMASQSLVRIGAPVVPELLPLIDRPELRNIAIATLAQIPDPDIVATVLAAVAHGPAELRALTLASLAGQDDDRIVAALIAGLRDPAAAVRRSAIGGLGGRIRSHEEDWLGHLSPLLEDLNEGVARQAAIVLGRLPAGVEVLARVLQRPVSLALKLEAIRSLSWIGTAPAIAALGDDLDDCLAAKSQAPIGPSTEDLAADLAADLPTDLALRISALIKGLGRIAGPGQPEAALRLVHAVVSIAPTPEPLDSEPLRSQLWGHWIWAIGQLRQPMAIDPLIAITIQSTESLRWHGIAALRRFDRAQIRDRLAHARSLNLTPSEATNSRAYDQLDRDLESTNP
jgi:HEAT repeat protein